MKIATRYTGRSLPMLEWPEVLISFLLPKQKRFLILISINHGSHEILLVLRIAMLSKGAEWLNCCNFLIYWWWLHLSPTNSKTRFLLGLRMEMLCLAANVILLEPTAILQPKMCDSAKPFSSKSLTTEICSVETWECVLGSRIPFFIVYPLVFVVGGVQITLFIWRIMSDKVQFITWSFTVYTSAEAGCIVTPVNLCCYSKWNISGSKIMLADLEFIVTVCRGAWWW